MIRSFITQGVAGAIGTATLREALIPSISDGSRARSKPGTFATRSVLDFITIIMLVIDKPQ